MGFKHIELIDLQSAAILSSAITSCQPLEVLEDHLIALTFVRPQY